MYVYYYYAILYPIISFSPYSPVDKMNQVSTNQDFVIFSREGPLFFAAERACIG